LALVCDRIPSMGMSPFRSRPWPARTFGVGGEGEQNVGVGGGIDRGVRVGDGSFPTEFRAPTVYPRKIPGAIK